MSVESVAYQSLRAEEQDLIKQGRELLLSDKLDAIQGNFSSRRGPSSLPDDLMILDTKLNQKLVRLEEQLAAYRTGTPSIRSQRSTLKVPVVNRVEELKVRISRRFGEDLQGILAAEAEARSDSERRRVGGWEEGHSTLSGDARRKIAMIEAGVWDGELKDGRRSRTRDDDIEALDLRRGSETEFDHRPFAELYSLSSEARNLAAPFVRDVYENVFMHSTARGDVVNFDSVRGVRVLLHVCVPWCEAVRLGGTTMGWSEGKIYLEEALARNCADALGVPRTRVRVASIELRASVAEVHILPDALHATAAPGCLEVARALCAQARDHGSPLRSLDVGHLLVGGDVRDAVPAPLPGVASEPYLQDGSDKKYEFSLLHGGLIEVDPHRATGGGGNLNARDLRKVKTVELEYGGADDAEGAPLLLDDHDSHRDTQPHEDQQHEQAYRVQGTRSVSSGSLRAPHAHAHHKADVHRGGHTRSDEEEGQTKYEFSLLHGGIIPRPSPHGPEQSGRGGYAERDSKGFWRYIEDMAMGKPAVETADKASYGTMTSDRPRPENRAWVVWGVLGAGMLALALWVAYYLIHK